MGFGHPFYPLNFDPSRDCDAIEECLLEPELAEQLGFDAIWIWSGDGKKWIVKGWNPC